MSGGKRINYQSGDYVDIYSRTAKAWLPGEITSKKDDTIVVEYDCGNDVFQKQVACDSTDVRLSDEQNPNSPYRDPKDMVRTSRGSRSARGGSASRQEEQDPNCDAVNKGSVRRSSRRDEQDPNLTVNKGSVRRSSRRDEQDPNLDTVNNGSVRRSSRRDEQDPNHDVKINCGTTWRSPRPEEQDPNYTVTVNSGRPRREEQDPNLDTVNNGSVRRSSRRDEQDPNFEMYQDEPALLHPREKRGLIRHEQDPNFDVVQLGHAYPSPRTKKSVVAKAGTKSVYAGGKYIPGTDGNSYVRDQNAEETYRAHPSILERINSNEASEIWNETRKLSYDEKLEDGFIARFSKELIVVDKTSDAMLREFLAYCRGLIAKSSPETAVRDISKAVGNALGDSDKANLPRRISKFLEEHTGLDHEKMLLGETYLGGPIFGLEHRPGFGICRHRSILFKYVMDELDICDCALVDGQMPPVKFAHQKTKNGRLDCRTGDAYDHMWNCISIDGSHYIVDALNAPGELLSPKDLESLDASYMRINGRTGMSLFKKR